MAQLNQDTTAKAFGDFIRQIREKQELTQLDIAEKLGITQSYYSNIELGKRRVDLFLALNICDLLGVDFNSFIRSLKMKKPQIVRPTIQTTTEEPPPV